jgi:hypothetical protein
MIAEIEGPEPVRTFLFVNHFPSSPYQPNSDWQDGRMPLLGRHQPS